MADTVSFERAIDYYDKTREMPEAIATHGIPALLTALGAEAHILEVGTGTGRISIPLLERGAHLIGCDISLGMMLRQRAKFAGTRLAQATALALPFPSAQFDAVFTVHVLHLIREWRAALREFKRVLKPGGVYINTWNWHADDTVDVRVRNYWRERVEAHGGEWRRPGIQRREDVLEEAQAMGARVESIEAAQATTTSTARELIDNIANKIYSDTWDVPPEIFEAAVRELRVWVAQEYPLADQPQPIEMRFILDAIRF